MIKLDGSQLAEEILSELAKQTTQQQLELAIIQVGNDYSSSLYVQKKRAACEKINIKANVWNLDISTSEVEILNLINKLNNDKNINGILVQLPLPEHIDTSIVLQAINIYKDVDMFNAATFDLSNDLKPCLVGAIDALLQKYDISLDNKKIVVIGMGKTGGLPIINWYKKQNKKIFGFNKNDTNINEYVKEADILITAIGNPNVIDANMIKPGAAFFDIGISRNAKNKKVCGDINYQQASKFAKWGTPVPGGIGPLTVVMLIKNLICLSKLQHD